MFDQHFFDVSRQKPRRKFRFTLSLASCPNRQGPKNILYSIEIAPAKFPANQEQAKQALTPVIISKLAPCHPGKSGMRNSNAVQYVFLDLVYIKSNQN